MIPSDLIINQDGSRNNYGAVRQRLEALGYIVVHEEVYDKDHGEHASEDQAYVLSVSPDPGTEYSYGREVTVVTATNSQVLPDFTGRDYKEVYEILTKAPYEFAVETVYVAAKESGQEGKIEIQKPAAGSESSMSIYS